MPGRRPSQCPWHIGVILKLEAFQTNPCYPGPGGSPTGNGLWNWRWQHLRLLGLRPFEPWVCSALLPSWVLPCAAREKGLSGLVGVIGTTLSSASPRPLEALQPRQYGW